MSEESNQQVFSTVGEQAQEVDNAIKQTGAADAEGHPVQEVESLCMNCHKNGVTRMLLTRIPYFREVIIMSFECPHCGFKIVKFNQQHKLLKRGKIRFKS